MPNSRDDEEAGAREPFEDAELYDFEYRRRRNDLRFYRRIAQERLDVGGGPIVDLACGSGRLLLPLLKDGHTVVGVDRAAAMLERAAARLRRLSPSRRQRALLLRGDLRALPCASPRISPRKLNGFGLAICAFHSIQHLVDDDDLLAFFRGARQSLVPGGWLAFDLLPPDPAWISRDSRRRWGRTVFRHPVTHERFVYTNNHVFDAARRCLHIRLYYQPIDQAGRPSGRERVRRLCHRQMDPGEVGALLDRAGLEIITTFGGFDGRPLAGDDDGSDEEHIYIVRRPKRAP